MTNNFSLITAYKYNAPQSHFRKNGIHLSITNGWFFSIKIPHMITWCENSLCHFNRANTNCVKHFYCYIYIYIYWFQRFLNVWKVPLHLWQEFTVRDHYWWMSALFFFLQGKKVCASFPLALWDNKKKVWWGSTGSPFFFWSLHQKQTPRGRSDGGLILSWKTQGRTLQF